MVIKGAVACVGLSLLEDCKMLCKNQPSEMQPPLRAAAWPLWDCSALQSETRGWRMLSWELVGIWCGPSHQPGEWRPKYLLHWKQPWDQGSWAKQPMGRAVRGTWGPLAFPEATNFQGRAETMDLIGPCLSPAPPPEGSLFCF